jgi:glutathione peroxidase
MGFETTPRLAIMLKTVLLVMFMLSPIIVSAKELQKKAAYSFVFTSIEGNPLPLKNFNGKAVLIVNTASRCGFTRQYNDLQAVWERYRDRGLVVLGVPSNDFGSQEPGSETEIKKFCEVNFNVDFPMTSKVSVKGKNAHPFYQWAAQQLGLTTRPLWNFHKYLISPDGELVEWFSSPTSPVSNRVLRAIEAHLPKK